MTETKKMRAILHELGIEYRDVNSMVTDVEHDGIKTRVYDYDYGPDYQLCVEQKWLTAEEAVRVALGIKLQEVLERRVDELCAEVEAEKQRNAKLRELVRNLLRVIPHDVSGVVVGVHGEHPTYYSFADAMHELGIEVD